jgi:hypothetical protein
MTASSVRSPRETYSSSAPPLQSCRRSTWGMPSRSVFSYVAPSLTAASARSCGGWAATALSGQRPHSRRYGVRTQRSSGSPGTRRRRRVSSHLLGTEPTPRTADSELNIGPAEGLRPASACRRALPRDRALEALTKADHEPLFCASSNYRTSDKAGTSLPRLPGSGKVRTGLTLPGRRRSARRPPRRDHWSDPAPWAQRKGQGDHHDPSSPEGDSLCDSSLGWQHCTRRKGGVAYVTSSACSY